MGFLIPCMLELRGVGFREFLRDGMLYFHLLRSAPLTRATASAQLPRYGFVLPEIPNVAVAPIVPKLHQNSAAEIAASMIERAGIKLVDVTGDRTGDP